MGWTLVVLFNVIIACCYLLIASIIFRGLLNTRQLRTNPLGLATAGIFLTCAVHHGEHAAHLLLAPAAADVRAEFGAAHSVAVDAVGAAVAVIYLSLRRRYVALLRTPEMFEDQVRTAAALRLESMAYTDLLTGLGNRAALQRFVDSLDPSARTSVAYIDLDGFKAVNDAHGHDAGDRVLKHVADRLVGETTADRQVFRLGGDEFLVVAVTDDDGLLEELQGVVASVFSELAVPVRDGLEFTVSASAGFASGSHGEHLEHVIRRADAQMYIAKAEAQTRPRPSAFVVVLPPQRRPDPATNRRVAR